VLLQSSLGCGAILILTESPFVYDLVIAGVGEKSRLEMSSSNVV